MAKLSRDLGVGTLHPRELIFGSGSLAAVNSEIVIACDGCATATLDLRGSFNLAVELAGTVDGSNWVTIPIRAFSPGSGQSGYMLATPALSTGAYVGSCIGFKQLRARCVSFTSGAAGAVLTATTAPLDGDRRVRRGGDAHSDFARNRLAPLSDAP